MTCLCGHPAADHLPEHTDIGHGIEYVEPGPCDLCTCPALLEDATEAMFEVAT